MLIDKDQLYEIIRCPKTGRKLTKTGDKLYPEDAAGNHSYDIINDYPVLIDFEKSILNRNEVKTLQSVIERRSIGNTPGNKLKRLIFPPKKHSIENVNHILDLLFHSNDNARVLIIGGGTIGEAMEPFYDDPRVELVSFDIYASPYVQFLADAHQVPLSDDSFDAVIIQAVLEHVLEPANVVSEIYRVLKKDGIVYAETPFLQHVHEGAYDFTRFTESGHRYLFRNFASIRSGVSAGAGTQLLWSLDYFFRGLFRSRNAGKLIKLCCFWLPYFDRLIPTPYNVDAANGVYFLGKKQESAIHGKDIVQYYQGAQR